MPTVKSFNGKAYHGPEATVVTIASESGSTAVVFDTAYEVAPTVAVITPRGAGGTYSATSVTKSGFTLSVTGEDDADFDDGDVTVYWFAMEG